MKNNSILTLITFLFSQVVFAQNIDNELISKSEVVEDLNFLNDEIQNVSSYNGLNTYDYNIAFEDYLESIKTNDVERKDFGLFLTKTLGNIGDRHSYVSGYNLKRSQFLPFTVAPLEDKVIGVKYDSDSRNYSLLHEKYPYLKSINGLATKDFLLKILPEEIKAPSQSYFRRAVKQLKYMEENYEVMEEVLPEFFEFIFTNDEGKDTLIVMPLERVQSKHYTWQEMFFDGREKRELNDETYAKKQFNIDENNIAYIRAGDMVKPKHAPIYFEELNKFMLQAKDSKSLIIDIRGNDGGSRHLIFELAKYLIHPDSIHVVNIAQQRKVFTLENEYHGSLNRRSLFSMEQLDKDERKKVNEFLETFEPMYDLPKDKFTEPYFTLLNGGKLTEGAYYYGKPVYLLINERCFSSASVFAAVFKNLPNIKLVGQTTDGSSGNSEKFFLPNSKFAVKLSTMISFQKDGKILDGYGTEPDIEIARNLDQVLWKEDYQLKRLKDAINKVVSSVAKETHSIK